MRKVLRVLVLNADADTGVEGEDLMARTKVRVADAISAVSQRNVISIDSSIVRFQSQPKSDQDQYKRGEGRCCVWKRRKRSCQSVSQEWRKWNKLAS